MTERTNILEDQRWKWKEETLAGVPDVCQGLVGKWKWTLTESMATFHDNLVFVFVHNIYVVIKVDYNVILVSVCQGVPSEVGV